MKTLWLWIGLWIGIIMIFLFTYYLYHNKQKPVQFQGKHEIAERQLDFYRTVYGILPSYSNPLCVHKGAKMPFWGLIATEDTAVYLNSNGSVILIGLDDLKYRVKNRGNLYLENTEKYIFATEFEASLGTTIFFGVGEVLFDCPQEVKPEWFGAGKALPTTTNEPPNAPQNRPNAKILFLCFQ